MQFFLLLLQTYDKQLPFIMSAGVLKQNLLTLNSKSSFPDMFIISYITPIPVYITLFYD